MLNLVTLILAVFCALSGGDMGNIIVGALLLLSIYSICISILGYVGIIIKKKKYIGYYSVGLWLSFVFISFVIIAILLQLNDKSCKNSTLSEATATKCQVRNYLFMYLYTIVPTQFCLHILLKLYAYVLENIFKNDLGNYII